jgi:hypothetical protein
MRQTSERAPVDSLSPWHLREHLARVDAKGSNQSRCVVSDLIAHPEIIEAPSHIIGRPSNTPELPHHAFCGKPPLLFGERPLPLQSERKGEAGEVWIDVELHLRYFLSAQ